MQGMNGETLVGEIARTLQRHREVLDECERLRLEFEAMPVWKQLLWHGWRNMNERKRLLDEGNVLIEEAEEMLRMTRSIAPDTSGV